MKYKAKRKKKSPRLAKPKQLKKVAVKTPPLAEVEKEKLPPKEYLKWLNNDYSVLIIFITGLVAFATGMFGPFQTNVSNSIVNNTLIRSLKHIKLFYEGGSFYGGHVNAPLIGNYYRPLEVTVYSVVYSLFGPHAFYFHILQLLLYIIAAMVLFLVFRFSFNPLLSLVLTLIFMVHPINSQVVFGIASLQDVLFFLFGIWAFYLLLRYPSVKSLIGVVICLFLSMLSKETAFVFVVMSALYLLWWDRKRLLPFILMAIPPSVIYFILKIHAVGFARTQHSGPIDNLKLAERLVNIPEIILFYLSKLVFPYRLASGYYWVHPQISFRYFWGPLLIDLAVLAAIIYIAKLVKKKGDLANYYTFVFFAVWVAVGLLPYLQIIPLSTTVYEPWFYFSMAGVLGMVGICSVSFNAQPKQILVVGSVLVCVLGVRTVMRGLDWDNINTLALKDVAASPADYLALNNASQYFTDHHKYQSAISYSQRSASIYPGYDSHYDLGVDEALVGNYPSAQKEYKIAMSYKPPSVVYDDAALLQLAYGTTSYGAQFFNNALKLYPKDKYLWLYLSLFVYKYGYSSQAQTYMKRANSYGSISQTAYSEVLQNEPVKLNFMNTGRYITIH